MPQSLCRVVLHIVFSTKDRRAMLRGPDLRDSLFAYMAGVLQNHGCSPILINGVDDHVHLLINFSRTVTIADLVEALKTASSKWVNQQRPGLRRYRWQSGYGVFSVSESNVDKVREYIANQEQHHRRRTFQDEFRALCRKHKIEIDERYVWD